MKVLISDKLANVGIEILKKNGFMVDYIPSGKKLIDIIGDYDVLIVRSGTKVTKDVLEKAKKLKIIGRAGVGVDNIDLETATKLGIVVMNTPYANVNAAAEHTLTLLMMLAKHIIHSHISLKKGEWKREKYKGIELKGKTLGVIGLGKVGKKVAKVARCLEMNVIFYDPFVKEFEFAEKVDFDYLIRNSDFITVHVPKTKETINLIDKEEFEKMKQGVRILNVARGGIINEQALYNAIKEGKVIAAAIDVWEEEPPKCELVKLEQVITTPHLGASTIEAQENVAKDIATQIIEAFKGNLINVVNNVREIRQC